MNLTENEKNYGYERKHKQIVLCPKCKQKANIYYTPFKPEQKHYWLYDYKIIGVNCEHIHTGVSHAFHAFVKSIMPTSQTKLPGL